MKQKQGEMRYEKSDGSYGSRGRGFRKWQTSCNGVKQIMKKDKIHSRPFTHIKGIRLLHFFDPLSPKSRILFRIRLSLF